jgi:hypothetical protein
MMSGRRFTVTEAMAFPVEYVSREEMHPLWAK